MKKLETQRIDDYLLIKEFNSYKERVEKTLRDLETALSSLRKNSEALSATAGNTDSALRIYSETLTGLVGSHNSLAITYDKSRKDIDVAFDRIKGLENIVSDLEQNCDYLLSFEGGGDRNRHWR